MRTQDATGPRPGVISHRGICRTTPWSARRGENTLEALVSGIHALRDAGLPSAVEFDVRECRDGVLVLLHDRTLDRTTNGHGRLRDFTFDEISRLDAGYGRRIPRLADVLDTLSGIDDVECCIELKERGLIARVKALIMERGLAHRTIVSSFRTDDPIARTGDRAAAPGWDELELLRPTIKFALIAGRPDIKRIGAHDLLVDAVRRGACAVHSEYAGTTRTLVSTAHQMGLQVNVFTVNRPRAFEQSAILGVDNVFCDNPRFLATQITGSHRGDG